VAVFFVNIEIIRHTLLNKKEIYDN